MDSGLGAGAPPRNDEQTLTSRLNGIADQGLAERPDRARHPMGGGDHVVEGVLDQVAILIGDDERRQQLDGVAGMAGDLGQHLVVA